MKILSFVKSLLPHVEREQVLEDLRVTIGELDDVVLPSYRAAGEHFRSNKFKSEQALEMTMSFYQSFDLQGAQKQPTIINEVDRRLPHLRDNADYISALIEELMDRDIYAEGLNAKKAALIRAAEHLSFASRYAVDLLSAIYGYEATEVDAQVSETMRRSPDFTKKIKANLSAFAAIISKYGIPRKDFEKIVLKIPDVGLSSKLSAVVAGMYKERDLDPISPSVVQGFVGNPIYHVRMMVAEYQVARYKANKEKSTSLSLQLMLLKEQQQNKKDPALEQRIRYTQDRIDKLEAENREVERELGMA